MDSKKADKLKKALGKDNACYVVITCALPTEDGKMDVEMTYEGDETLASYLLENAQQIMDDRLKNSVEA